MRKFMCGALMMAVAGTMAAGDARFAYYTYSGNDARFDKELDASTQYLNPILAGFYPDPSICRKGDTFYLVNSSFSFFPGVPIFESKDLVNWRQIGHVLSRESQLELKGLGVSRGIYAPAISYNKNNDTFYMVTTLVDNGGNFFVKSKDPSKGWSDPIWLPAVDGIDPSFLFDDDGKGYIVHNAPVFGTAAYEGERAIRLLHFDVDSDATVGDPIEIVRSGTHVRPNPIWIEGPHLYHIGDWYYLMCAEGGTCEDHSEVIFRAKNPEGPWEESPLNPILTQREGLPADRADIVTSTGHADIIQDADGNWWAVFLGCRPYEGDLYNTGRDTFLLPVEWRDGWPVILEPGVPVPTVVGKEGLQPGTGDLLTGNFTYTDRFDGDRLDDKWIFLRNPLPGFYELGEGGLTLHPAAGDVTRKERLSAIFRRQQHTDFTAETELDFTPSAAGDLAGMVLLQNEDYNFILGKTKGTDGDVLILRRNAGPATSLAVSPDTDQAASEAGLLASDPGLLASAPLADGPVKLRIEGKGKLYSFYYQPSGSASWLPLALDVDASNLSTSLSGGFIGAVIGLYATIPTPK